MPRTTKLAPIDVFEDNIADAERLLALTRALLNTRSYRMRAERRRSFGDVLRVPVRDQDKLDCVESGDVFIIIKPGGSVRRVHFAEPQLRPLLRQAVVAISAAVESYIAEKAVTYIGSALKEPPPRLAGLAVSLGDVLEIEERYARRKWGYRNLIQQFLEREASPSPNKIGTVLGTVGKRDFWPKVDGHRKVRKGQSIKDLEALYLRRNRIAHAGDRVGSGRAHLDVAEVEAHYDNAKSIVEALEAVL